MSTTLFHDDATANRFIAVLGKYAIAIARLNYLIKNLGGHCPCPHEPNANSCKSRKQMDENNAKRKLRS